MPFEVALALLPGLWKHKDTQEKDKGSLNTTITVRNAENLRQSQLKDMLENIRVGGDVNQEPDPEWLPRPVPPPHPNSFGTAGGDG